MFLALLDVALNGWRSLFSFDSFIIFFGEQTIIKKVPSEIASDIQLQFCNVRFWHKADIRIRKSYLVAFKAFNLSVAVL